MRGTKARHIEEYYGAMATLEQQGARSEGAVRMPFYNLLTDVGQPLALTVVGEQTFKVAGGRNIRVDGEIRDEFGIQRGIWEAKDGDDNLPAAIAQKIARGYPLRNTLFENTRHAVLYQNGAPVLEADLHDPAALGELLDRFLGWTEPRVLDFHVAVRRFAQEIPRVAGRLKEIIDVRKEESPDVRAALSAFHSLCCESLNPATTTAEVEDMLLQHLLTERIFSSVFRDRDFVHRNPIARQLEEISHELVAASSFSRDRFLAPLDPFYAAIEAAARTIERYEDKQHFLHSVYERFFQSFSTGTADTHGIVYTPGAIVRWMVNSVERVLQSHFEESLSDPGVNVLDPCVGTGTFMLEVLARIQPSALERKYASELHANEVLLLPYYVATQNLEHEYHERIARPCYKPFEGICFADTLGARREQGGLFAPKNAERIQRQEALPMRVILGNPPYNVGQRREGDNNRNPVHAELDERIRRTYAASSRATNVKALRDMYVRFFRYATDRLGNEDGVIAFVTNNSFLDQHAFDGMRRELRRDFTSIFVLDLGGNVRKNPKLSGTKHNVFGIQVGVAITILVRARKGAPQTSPAAVFHKALPEDWDRHQKLRFLADHADIAAVEDWEGWDQLDPDANESWLHEASSGAYAGFMALGSRESKRGRGGEPTIFGEYSLGVVTNRDWWVYDFDAAALARRVEALAGTYNGEVDRWIRSGRPAALNEWVLRDERRIKWSRDLKSDLKRMRYATFDPGCIRPAAYRPFVEKRYYFDAILSQDIFRQPRFFPDGGGNVAICLTDVGAEKPFGCLAVDSVPDLHLMGAGAGTQCFPFHVYDAEGERRDNVTDAALATFRRRYGADVTRWDVFDYVYGVLHSPVYRSAFAGSLRRELARVPLVAPPAFAAFVAAGRRLRELHLGYREVEPYPLGRVERDPFTWRVEQMRLSADRASIVVNDSLTLTGLPPEALEYEIGGRPAVQWVIDHVAVRKDGPSGIVHDPNPPGNDDRVVTLLQRVVRVAVESMALIRSLPLLEHEP
jgi:predicted helicase